MIKAIYFDWGQCFADDYGQQDTKIEKILKGFNIPLKKFKALWWKLCILRTAGDIRSDAELESYLNRILQKKIPVKRIIEIEADDKYVPVEHIAIAKELKKKYKIGILSNGVKEAILAQMRKYKIQDLFDAIIVSSEVGVRKPNALIYYEAVRKMAVKPEEIVFVSDEIADDLVAASGLGMKTIWFDRGRKAFTSEDKKVSEIYKPDAVVRKFSEIIPAIKEIQIQSQSNRLVR